MNHLIEKPTESELIQSILSKLTRYELGLLSNRIWDSMVESYGYQSFGFDARTMRINHPIEWEAYQLVNRFEELKLEESKND